jgi:hypothetical protein
MFRNRAPMRAFSSSCLLSRRAQPTCADDRTARVAVGCRDHDVTPGVDRTNRRCRVPTDGELGRGDDHDRPNADGDRLTLSHCDRDAVRHRGGLPGRGGGRVLVLPGRGPGHGTLRFHAQSRGDRGLRARPRRGERRHRRHRRGADRRRDVPTLVFPGRACQDTYDQIRLLGDATGMFAGGGTLAAEMDRKSPRSSQASNSCPSR